MSSSLANGGGGNGTGSGTKLGPRPANSALRADEYGGDFRPRTQSMLEPRVTGGSGESGKGTHSPMLTVRRLGRTISKEVF